MNKLVLAILLGFAAVNCSAQQAPASSASREQVLKLFDIMHIRQQMRSVMENVMQQQSTLMHDTIRKRYPQISADEMDKLNSFMAETMRNIPVDGMLDDMIPVYQKHLTPNDVDAMIAFYSSPTGQKLMQEMPAMTSEGMQAAYPRMQKQMELILKRVDEKIKQEEPKQNSPAKPQTEDHG